jgi:phosphoribosylamine--glycine ligase / phosphoribosylformylglycinamidine cyclo-ligase
VVAFHAGTVKEGDQVRTSGGRVIAVSAYAPSLQEALDHAYEGVEQVNFEGKVYRRDIGHRYVLQIALIRVPSLKKTTVLL